MAKVTFPKWQSHRAEDRQFQGRGSEGQLSRKGHLHSDGRQVSQWQWLHESNVWFVTYNCPHTCSHGNAPLQCGTIMKQAITTGTTVYMNPSALSSCLLCLQLCPNKLFFKNVEVRGRCENSSGSMQGLQLMGKRLRRTEEEAGQELKHFSQRFPGSNQMLSVC